MLIKLYFLIHMTLIFSYAIMLFQIALNTPTENYPYTFILDAFLVRFSII